MKTMKCIWRNVKVAFAGWMISTGERIMHSVYTPANFSESMKEIADA